ETTSADTSSESSEPISTPRTASSAIVALSANDRRASSSETVKPIPPRQAAGTMSANGIRDSRGSSSVDTQPNTQMPMNWPTGSATTIASMAGERSASGTAGITTSAETNANSGRMAPLTHGSSA